MTGHRMSLSHESPFFPSLPLILYNIVIHGRDADHLTHHSFKIRFPEGGLL